jgi:hypothetical protein
MRIKHLTLVIRSDARFEWDNLYMQLPIISYLNCTASSLRAKRTASVDYQPHLLSWSIAPGITLPQVWQYNTPRKANILSHMMQDNPKLLSGEIY